MAARDGGTERRLRSFLRHERMAVAMAPAESTHHSAPRVEKKARAREEVRVEVHGQVPEEPPLQVAGRRRCWIGFELVLGTAVLELGRELDEQIVDIFSSCWFEAFARYSRYSPRTGFYSVFSWRYCVRFKVLSQDRVQQPRLLKVFKVLSQDRVQHKLLGVVFKAQSSTGVACGGLSRLSPRTEFNRPCWS